MARASSSRLRRAALAAGCAGLMLTACGRDPTAGTPAVHSGAYKPLPVVPGSRYLALGDSITFGYREPDAVPGANYQKPGLLVGYPNDVARNLDLRVTNAACPGETTSSFINTSRQSDGCENTYSATPPHQVPGGYRAMYPLRVKYRTKTQSQLGFAEAFLRHYPATRLVTLMIGTNDGMLCSDRTADGCVSEFPTVRRQIANRVSRILGGLRRTGYRGQIVLLTYYSLDYATTLDNYEESNVNEAMRQGAKHYHVTIANGYGEFREAARQAAGNPCSAGLLTSTPSGSSPCGIHPSLAGHAVLAQAVEQAIRR